MFDVDKNSKVVNFNGANVRVMDAGQAALYLVASNNDYTNKMAETVKIAVAGPLEDKEFAAYKPVISDNKYDDVVKLDRESSNGLNRYGFLHYGFEAKMINEDNVRNLKPGCYYLATSLIKYNLLDPVDAKDLKPVKKQVKKPAHHAKKLTYKDYEQKLVNRLGKELTTAKNNGVNVKSHRAKKAVTFNHGDLDLLNKINGATFDANYDDSAVPFINGERIGKTAGRLYWMLDDKLANKLTVYNYYAGMANN